MISKGLDDSINLITINLFERIIKGNLPKGYRDFLVKHNVYRPEKGGFSSENGEVVSVVHLFYGMKVSKSVSAEEDLYDIFLGYIERVPAEFLVIASDPIGNQICLCLKGNAYGKVYYWEHEFEVDDGEIPTMDNMSLIANGFDEFLKGLYEDC